MEEVNHDGVKPKFKKKIEEKSSSEEVEEGAEQLEEEGGRDENKRDKKKRNKKYKEGKKREEELEEGGEGGEEDSRVSGKMEGKRSKLEKRKEKGKGKCDEETNKEEQSIKESRENQNNNKKKNGGTNAIETEKDGDLKKKRKKEEKRKREEEKDTEEGSNRAKKAKKTSKSEEKKKKNEGKKVRFSGEVEVFPFEKESEEGEEKLVRGKRFTKAEDDLILQAVNDYIKLHQLGENGSEMILHCKKYAEIRNCWDEIISCIPSRPKLAIYNRAHVLLTRNRDYKWSIEDLNALRKHKANRGSRWKEFADQYGINRKAVKDVWRTIRLPNLRSGHWSQEEYQKLFDLVNLDLKMKAFGEKKTMHGMLKDNISWEAISDKLATRLHSFCCVKWYDQLSSPMVKEGLWLDTDDYRLIQALQETDANCMEEVEWDYLLEHRDGEVCRKRWEQMVRYIGDHKEKSFIEQVDLLSKRYCLDMLEYREKYNGEDLTTDV